VRRKAPGDDANCTFHDPAPPTRVDGVEDGRTSSGVGIGDLRRRQPADDTMRNLLDLMRDKLDTCARLPVFELEANNEGHTQAAALFRELCEVERDSFDALKAQLRAEIESTTAGNAHPSAERRFP